MQRKKLLRLAKHLRAISRMKNAKSRFRLSNWGWDESRKKSIYDGNYVYDEKQKIQTDPKECGTSGCACGFATGLFNQKNFYIEFKAGSARGWLVYETKEGMWDGMAAAARFFGINRTEALYLFDPPLYPKDKRESPVYVAKRIENMVAGTTDKKWFPE